jgi:hypothetical protein
MKLPKLLPLDAAERAVGQALWRRAIVDHMQREAIALPGEHADRTDRFASRPQAKLLQAVARQIGAAYRCCCPDKYHRDRGQCDALVIVCNDGANAQKCITPLRKS